MKHKNQSEDVQFDENGNPVNVTSEPDFSDEFIPNVVDLSDNADYMVSPYELLDYAILVATRKPGERPADGQGGTAEFKADDVLSICYRLDVTLTDKEIKSYIRKQAKRGAIIQAAGKRGYYCTGRLLSMTHEDLMAEFNRLRDARNPTQR